MVKVFTSNSTENRSNRRHSSQPISWLGENQTQQNKQYNNFKKKLWVQTPLVRFVADLLSICCTTSTTNRTNGVWA